MLLRESQRLAELGYPLLLSASNKTFLGELLGLDITQRRDASLAAAALGIVGGCRVLRVHDVRGTVRVRDVLDAVLSADPGNHPGNDPANDPHQAHDPHESGRP